MSSIRPLRSSVAVPALLLVFSLGPAVDTLEAQDHVTLSRPIPGPVVPPPYFRAALENGTRSADGRPGPNYWQVYSEYDIDARLDPITGLLSGTETIRFHNRSPQGLPVLQLFLHQNLHKPGVVRNRVVEVTGGVRLGRVKVGGEDLLPLPGFQGAGYRDPDGVMSIRLPEPLGPGGTVELEIDWSFVVPQNGAGRMGHSDREMYFLAYWFPKIAVLDDLRGWDAEPYQGAEFYEGYGDYSVRLTVPQGWTAMATGDLKNPEEVYSPRTLAKMAAAAVADTMIRIATREDVETGRVTRLSETGALTYWFEAENVRDFTWTASNKQLWTGTSALVPDRDGDGQDDRVAIHSFFREYRAPLWIDQALYGKHSIESESRYTGFPYPWPHMTSVEGADIIGGGMEFPMLTLIGDYQGADPIALYSVTAHELAHMWIPMIVGANEKRHAWIDEGSTTFLENQVKTDYWPGIPDPDAADMENYLQVTRRELPSGDPSGGRAVHDAPWGLLRTWSRVRDGIISQTCLAPCDPPGPPGGGDVHPGLPELHLGLGLQAPVSLGLLQHVRAGGRHRPGLVLDLLLLPDLAAGSRGEFGGSGRGGHGHHHRGQGVRLSPRTSDGGAGGRGGAGARGPGEPLVDRGGLRPGPDSRVRGGGLGGRGRSGGSVPRSGQGEQPLGSAVS